MTLVVVVGGNDGGVGICGVCSGGGGGDGSNAGVGRFEKGKLIFS